MNIFRRRGYILPLVCFRPYLNLFRKNIRESKYKLNNMRHQISTQTINQYLKCLIMIYNFDFLVSWLPDIVQKCFCTLDGVMDPSHLVCLKPDILLKQSWDHFWDPLCLLMWMNVWIFFHFQLPKLYDALHIRVYWIKQNFRIDQISSKILCVYT